MIDDEWQMIDGDDDDYETWITSTYKNSLDGCDKSMPCDQTNAVGDSIGERVLQILDIGDPKPRFWRGPDQLSRSERMSLCGDPRIVSIQ